MSSLPHDIPICVVGARNDNCARVSSSPCTPVCKSVSVCFNRREERGEERTGEEGMIGEEGRIGEEEEERRGEERRGGGGSGGMERRGEDRSRRG